MEKQVKTGGGWFVATIKLFAFAIISFLLSTLLVVTLLRFVNPNLTLLMIANRSHKDLQGEKHKIRKQWVPIDEISPQMVRAVIAAEDGKFMIHNGFDWEAIQEALKHNQAGRRLRGASTISQQTAKNVFLWQRRSWVRKGLEFYFTVLMEALWSKERIMEVYLNVIEFGRGVYGVEQISQECFAKPAAKLTRNDAALLATVLPSPKRRNPKAPGSYMQSYQQIIISNMETLPPEYYTLK